MLPTKDYSIEIGGKTLTARFSTLAEQTNGSVIIQYGDTVVMTNVVMGRKDRLDLDYFPLMVEYEEKYYAVGRILGSRFVKREGKASEEAVLTGRMIDRSIRPLFDHRLRRDVQVVATVLSYDTENDPDMVGLNGASLALACSNIPWDGPAAAVRIAKNGGTFIVNPTFQERREADLDLFLAMAKGKINMIDGEGCEMPETDVMKAIELGIQELNKLIAFQESIIKERGAEKTTVVLKESPVELITAIKGFVAPLLDAALFETDKVKREVNLESIKTNLVAHLVELGFDEDAQKEAHHILEDEIDRVVHKNAIEHSRRPDGRALDEVRHLEAYTGILPRTHGSAVFMRGTTHALATVTLGAPGDEQIVETMEESTKRHFMLHYNFPAYSSGETGPFRGPGRREIGHGALAAKSLVRMIPDKEQFPYTIRAVSEITSSNGSTSQASICGVTLALMDAGVPIKEMVGGIAMGLMSDPISGAYKVLTDIQGPEDHYGDMDFKVAGTKNGINAIQLDVKIDGLTMPIIEETLAAAKKARLHILETMRKEISEPRKELSPYAPRIITLHINPDKIRDVIGSGGKVINDIIARTNTTIDIEDDGTIYVTGLNATQTEEAITIINSLTKELALGEIIEGPVTRIMDFGALVEILPGKEGMIHISELANTRVEKVTDIVKLGERVRVKVIRIDPDGKIGLSLKALQSRN
ncbi:MAG: polyribonucleotide nucleotidyltransferase [Patescibacteria group bacterium]|nr:polyribonucleotide nucleotidyltransferase [Patescibacteria group bacterium]MDE2438526.1 polyribonucleotide nucleotidyltransferase [Patescibacteria group bacterium]